VNYSEEAASDYRRALGVEGQLVDVREPREFAAQALPEAVNIPLGELPARLSELDRSRRVVVICRSGGRSANGAELLVGCGFTDVVNLSDGMLAVHSSSKGTRS
jgi:rhodanese-related sulfurtransferase